jgi:hypothetical protein
MKEELNQKGQSLLSDEKLEGITGGGGGYGYFFGEGRDPNSQYSTTRCYKYNTSDCCASMCDKFGMSSCVNGYEKI